MVYAKKDQWKHINAIQSHQITALCNRILTETVTDRKNYHGKIFYGSIAGGKMFVKTAGQKPAKSKGSCGKLQHYKYIKKSMKLCLFEKYTEQHERRGQIVTENADIIAAQSFAEGVGDIVFSRENILEIGIEIQILDTGIVGSHGISTERCVSIMPE